MSESTALTIVAQRDVDFYGDELAAVRTAAGDIYVSLRHMCDALGIDSTGQRQRIQRHAVLERGLMVCNLQTSKGERESYVLRLELMPLWLTGIRASAVREEIRPKIERFQTEAARVLWHAFEHGELSLDESFDDLLAHGGEAVEAYQMLQAMLKLARNQIVLQAQVRTHEQRLDAIEATLGNAARQIDAAQASRLSQAVKTVALALGQRSGRNEFGGVYGELYRRFDIAGYRELPAARFEEALGFLRQWYQALVGEGEVPF